MMYQLLAAKLRTLSLCTFQILKNKYNNSFNNIYNIKNTNLAVEHIDRMVQKVDLYAIQLLSHAVLNCNLTFLGFHFRLFH